MFLWLTAHTHTHTHTYKSAHTHLHKYIDIHIYIYILIHAHMHKKYTLSYPHLQIQNKLWYKKTVLNSLVALSTDNSTLLLW